MWGFVQDLGLFMLKAAILIFWLNATFILLLLVARWLYRRENPSLSTRKLDDLDYHKAALRYQKEQEAAQSYRDAKVLREANRVHAEPW